MVILLVTLIVTVLVSSLLIHHALIIALVIPKKSIGDTFGSSVVDNIIIFFVAGTFFSSSVGDTFVGNLTGDRVGCHW